MNLAQLAMGMGRGAPRMADRRMGMGKPTMDQGDGIAALLQSMGMGGTGAVGGAEPAPGMQQGASMDRGMSGQGSLTGVASPPGMREIVDNGASAPDANPMGGTDMPGQAPTMMGGGMRRPPPMEDTGGMMRGGRMDGGMGGRMGGGMGNNPQLMQLLQMLMGRRG